MSTRQRTGRNVSAWIIRVQGTVQGVGFRPHVFKLARERNISGSVCNDGQGVLIEAWCKEDTLHQFVHDIQFQAPALANIQKVEIANVSDRFNLPESMKPTDFTIAQTHSTSVTTDIPPDAATCVHCLADCFDTENRRYRYPFTNCTNCGPRLSIIRSMPYDRSATSMSEFKMCERCQSEYDDSNDRRFHAQPNACPTCGPSVWLEGKDGSVLDWNQLSQFDVVDAAANLIKGGNDRPLRIMEFCGGHTHAIFRFGLEQLLPQCIELVHGPGCPITSRSLFL